MTLFERSDKLGGQVNVACLAPGRQEFGGIARFLEGELERLGVGVRLKTEANVDVVLAEHPDCVIIATGSTPFLPPIPGAEGGNCTTAHEVMEGRASTGQRVVVIDTQGLRAGCDVANFLAERGKDVELVTGMPYVGQNIQAGVWRHLYQELLRKRVRLSPLTGVAKIGESTVSTFHRKE